MKKSRLIEWLIVFFIGVALTSHLNGYDFISPLIKWVIFCTLGYLISLYLANNIIQGVIDQLYDHIQKQAENDGEPIPNLYSQQLYISGKKIGVYERGLFTGLIAYHISGVATAMFVYITVKMTIDWLNLLRRDEADHWKVKAVRSLVFRTLIGNIMSMGFAFIGGLIFRFGIPK